jgi:hypothetical protein
MTRIPPLAQRALKADIEDSIKRRSVVEIRAFAREAELSDMAEEARRGFEVADMIEAWEAKANRAERDRIKAAADAALQPTTAERIRSFDLDVALRGEPFDVNSFEANERERADAQNQALAAQQQAAEEQRARQVEELDTERPWQR